MMMILKHFKVLLLFSWLFFMVSCAGYKQVAYLQNVNSLYKSTENTPLYDARIMPKDLLTITVNTSDPATAAPFNLTVATANTVNSNNLMSQPTLQQYLVDNDGNIEYPVLGTLHISKLTIREAEKMIKEKLMPYLKESPIVNVRMANYKISVMGEVSRPGTFSITNEKVNIFEALAMAGDLTIYGQRQNLKLIRENANGERQVALIDLCSTDIISSPYYYLQQNDVIYVTPNRTRAKSANISNSTSLWLSGGGILVSIASLIATLVR